LLRAWVGIGGIALSVLERASAATDLDLISYLRSIPNARMRHGVRFPAWYLLLVAIAVLVSSLQGIRCKAGGLAPLCRSLLAEGPPHCADRPELAAAASD